MLIVAPTPLLAANFVMMGRIVRRLGVKYSRLSPRLCSHEVQRLTVRVSHQVQHRIIVVGVLTLEFTRGE